MPTVDDTPARLVAAATQLIADGGEEATSLRAVSRAARSNAAAVHYHFGGRDELLAAVITALLEPVQRRRFELLDEARERHGDAAPADAVAAALVRPDLELLAALRPDRVRVARLLGQPAPPGSAVASVLDRQFEALAATVVPLLDPSVAPDERRLRLRWVLAVSASVLAMADGVGEPDEARLVGFCAAGLGAPPTPVRPAAAPAKTAKTAKAKVASAKLKKRRKTA